MYATSGNFRHSYQAKYHKQQSRAQQFSQNGTNFEANFSYEYWCETCDKGFRKLALLEIHKQHHQKCNIDGCQFIAHPKVITKHIQMQHSTGLYKKIAKLNDPEEIKKWREERKRRYPTKENIEKKAAEIKEKVERGEKMGIRHNPERRNFHKSGATSKDYGQHKQLQQPSKFSSKRFDSYSNRRKRSLNVDTSEKHHEPKKACKAIVIPEETRKLKPFGGIQSLILDNDYDNDFPMEHEDFIEEDEYLKDAPSIQESNNSSKPLLCGALSSLIGDYESSDEDDLSGSTLKNDKNVKLNEDNFKYSKKLNIICHEVGNNISCANIVQGCTEQLQKQEIIHQNICPKENVSNQNEIDIDSGPEETKVIKSEPVNEDTDKLTIVRKHKKDVTQKFIKDNPRTNKYKTFRRKIPSTLLEKLLHKEIQHERNIILQCIRYIVKNNYFEKNLNVDM